MRNLKKILALVLALVMSLSLVTVANAAIDFDDVAEIDHKEAVDVMTAIGVIDGMDGSFNPDGTLTREQAAKIVAYMLLGEKADKLGAVETGFADVAASRWSAPYIAYCASLGILDGAGDGNFYPAGQLTGYAFAKMLLCAIGYGVNKEYTGANWMLNVARDGIMIDLFAGAVVEDAPISRDNAVQIAFNALCADLVTYSELFKAYTNNAYMGSQTLLGTLKTKVFGLVETPCTENAAGYNSHYWTIGGKAVTDKYVCDKVLGTVTDPTTTWGQLKKAYTFTANYDKWANGTNTTNVATSTGTTSFGLVNGQTAYLVDSCDAKDGKVDKIVFATEYLAKVDKVTAATASTKRTIDITLYDGTTGGADINGIETENFAKGDYILVVTSTTATAPLSMKKAEVVTGSVSAYYATQTGSVTVNGAKYKYDNIFTDADALGYSNISSYTLNTATYNFYLDTNGYVIGVAVVKDTVDNYAYVLAKGEDAFEMNNIVKVLLSDGTIKQFTLSSKSAGYDKVLGDDGAEVALNATYSYTINADGELVLKALPIGDYKIVLNTTDAEVVDSFTKGYSYIKYNTSNFAYATDETVFMWVAGGEVKGYFVGKSNAPSITSENATVVVKTVDGVDYAEMVIVDSTLATSFTDNYVYVLKETYVGRSTDTKGDAIYYYDVVLGDKATVIATYNATLAQKGVYKYSAPNALFAGDAANGVEAGVYNLTLNAATYEVVGVSSNANVIVDASNVDQYVVGDAKFINVEDPTKVEFNATFAVGDQVEIVYTVVNGLNIAKTIYIVG